jgi:hypothetical protein
MVLTVYSGGGVDENIFGRQQVGYPMVRTTPTEGQLKVWSNSNLAFVTISGAYTYGQSFSLLIDLTPTGMVVSVDGVVVANQEVATALSTTPNTHWVGSTFGTGNSADAAIRDLRLTDPASATNSAFFPLDGTFENTLAGSSVADATPSGPIQWVTVLSPGGSESPVLGLPVGSYRETETGVAAGPFAAPVATGSNWTAVGFGAAFSSTTGNSWTAVGRSAGLASTTATDWTAVGFEAGRLNLTGAYWTAVGHTAGRNNQVGSNWTAVGVAAGYFNVATGNTNNIFLGHSAGSATTTASNCTYIGTYTGSDRPTVNNVLALSTGTTLRFLFDGTNYFLPSLPTTDPGVPGALWDDAGVLSVSQ